MLCCKQIFSIVYGKLHICLKVPFSIFTIKRNCNKFKLWLHPLLTEILKTYSILFNYSPMRSICNVYFSPSLISTWAIPSTAPQIMRFAFTAALLVLVAKTNFWSPVIIAIWRPRLWAKVCHAESGRIDKSSRAIPLLSWYAGRQ